MGIRVAPKTELCGAPWVIFSEPDLGALLGLGGHRPPKKTDKLAANTIGEASLMSFSESGLPDTDSQSEDVDNDCDRWSDIRKLLA